ncbi:PilC beta-propeller domain protein [Acinetobacter sp. WC-323]|uniref:PilC/PilY family type IV pilus protein n=1 Tax=Acinetobacter sp. WC-323 TaxID=903918 RepID=UPI00029E7EEB|nr:PilC/PilY family type IV pilus protein [Acinetobacter sp. WC-323]EKU53379.1 PilC beta-propeller domain protein [Acinetobacter sp. WC-323]
MNNKNRNLTECECKPQKKIRGLISDCTIISSFFIISSVAWASDIEIYQNPSNSNVIMLMVDISQSMGTGPIADLQRDYPLCLQGGLLGGTKGLLQKAGVNVDANLLGLVKIDTSATATDTAYCEIPSELVVNILETVNNTTGDLLGLRGSAQYIKESCEPIDMKKGGTVEIIKGYRCYNRLHNIKQAVKDVIDGNDAKGIGKLPDGVSVGLSVFPANAIKGNYKQKNELAGMIAVEAQPLDATQRARIKAEIDKVGSVDPVNNSLTKVSDIVKKLLALDVVGAITGVLDIVLTLIPNLKQLAGLSTPTATAYAETGAYLLGNTTAGTGDGKKSKEVWRFYQGEYYKCKQWLDEFKCSDTGWEKSTKPRLNNDYDWVSDETLLDRLLGSESGGGLIGSIVDGITGLIDGLLKGVLGKSLDNILGQNDLTKNLPKAEKEKLLGASEVIFYKNTTQQSDSPYSGFSVSIDASKENNIYKAPTSTNASCSAKGIYVLTGSIPDLDPNLLDGLLGSSSNRSPSATNPVQRLMSQSINTAFSCATVPSGWDAGKDANTWNCIANYAGVLKNNTHNIKTGVGGIGREFSHISSSKTGVETSNEPNSILGGVLQPVANLIKALDPVLSLLGLGNLVDKLNKILDNILPVPLDQDTHNKNVANLARWGVHGGGGWYQLSNSKSIAQSILDFNQNLVETEADPIGLQTLPADPLTPYRMTNEVYKSMFEPTDKVSWFGNFKKYGLETNNSVNKLKDAWDNAAKDYDVKDWNKGGLLKQLQNLPTKTNNADPAKPIITQRKLLINRDCVGTGNTADFKEVGVLKTINNQYLDKVCGTDTTAKKDPNGHFLMNLLGYKVNKDATTASLTEANRTHWQVGMNLHSTPIKLTQGATFNADNSIKERQDYMLFGTTQGVLHVVDVKTGEESFAFVPNEMLESSKQQQAFMTPTTGHIRNPDNMAYGIDGAWTLYSEYVYGMKEVSSGSTTKEVVATVGEIKNGSNVIHGKQIAYGGLRMGGRSYYALDLSNLDSPKLKFHIDPISGKVYSKDNPDGKPFDAIKNMGQSWSKPTITTVIYEGAPRRVMLVGGGYDMEYENIDLSKSKGSGNNKIEGTGIYMFDADNGDLIWHASGDNPSTSCGKGDTEHGLKIQGMGSVVSRINTVDRNGDGITDHLYFGDLEGQVWRIDLSANLGKERKATSDNKDTGCGSYSMLFKAEDERFYEAPNFSVYGYEQPLAVVSIASGNRSLPLSDKDSSSRIYNIFDREVIGKGFDTNNKSGAKLELADLQLMPNDLNGKTLNDVAKDIPNGWYVSAETVEAQDIDKTASFDKNGSKVLGEMVVMNKSLYASIYNPNATTDSCKVQAQGITTVQRYCLPFGVCEQETDPATMRFGGGRGIVDVMVGAGIGTSENGVKRQILNPGLASVINKANGMPINTMRRQIVPLKWYERNE